MNDFKTLPPMKPSKTVVGLSLMIVVLALVAASVGVFRQGGDGPLTFTTLRGETGALYGYGLYRYDSLFAGAGNKVTDAVTLALGIPLFVIATLLYRRGSLRGGLLLLGALAWFLYTYAGYALGAVAYNDLFLVYVALFSSSLFAFMLAFRSLAAKTLSFHASSRLPRLAPAVFMMISGLLTLAVWLIAPLSALFQGGPPDRLDSYTTLFTNALDIAVIVPTTFIAGVLILRRDPLGYLIACPLLVLEVLLAPMIAAQTVSQLAAGVSFTLPEIVGPMAGFVVLALLAFWVVVAIYRNLKDGGTSSQENARLRLSAMTPDRLERRLER